MKDRALEARGLAPEAVHELHVIQAALDKWEQAVVDAWIEHGCNARAAAKKLDRHPNTIYAVLGRQHVRAVTYTYLEAATGRRACLVRALAETGSPSGKVRLAANDQVARLNGLIQQKLEVNIGTDRGELEKARFILRAYETGELQGLLSAMRAGADPPPAPATDVTPPTPEGTP